MFNSLEAGPLVNILLCEGKPGKVIEVQAKRRTGPENFVTVMRKALGVHYGEKPVGLGGVFVIARGKAKIHVMVSSAIDKGMKAEKHCNICFSV